MRFVELSLARIYADLPEEGFHAEGAGLVWDDRHYALPQLRVLEQERQNAHEGHRRGDFAIVRSLERLLEEVERWSLDDVLRLGSCRQIPPQRLSPLVEILHLVAVRRRFVKSSLDRLFVGDRNFKPLLEEFEILVAQFLRLVREVAPFSSRRAKAIAFDGHRKYYR